MSNRPARVSPESPGAPSPDPRDFLAGARVSFTSPILVSFAFSDDVWYLLDRLPKGVSPHQTRMNFGLFPKWLRDSMKRYVAHLWLERRVSLGACQAMIESTTRFVEALAEGTDPFPGPLEGLTRFHGQRFSAYLDRRARIGHEVKARMAGRPRVEVHRAMAEARGLSAGTAFNSARRLNQFGAWLRAEPQRSNSTARSKPPPSSATRSGPNSTSPGGNSRSRARWWTPWRTSWLTAMHHSPPTSNGGSTGWRPRPHGMPRASVSVRERPTYR